MNERTVITMSMMFTATGFADVERQAIKYGDADLLNDLYERTAGKRPKRITKKLEKATLEELAKLAGANGVEYSHDDDGTDTTLYFRSAGEFGNMGAQAVFELVGSLSTVAIGNALVHVYGEAPAIIAA